MFQIREAEKKNPLSFLSHKLNKFKLVYEYAKLRIHELIHYVWLTIKLNNKKVLHKTNRTKKFINVCGLMGLIYISLETISCSLIK